MSGRFVRLACTAALAAQAVLAPVPAVAAPDPGERSAAELLTDLQRLYREAEQATEAYNAAEEELKKSRTETERLDSALARARLTLHDSLGAAGRLARQQYQNSTAFSPYVRLLLARDPQHALDQGHVIGRLARERAQTVARLEGTERRSRDLARAARKALDGRLTLAERRKKARDDVRERLAAVEKLLASLPADRLAELAELERAGVDHAQEELTASGALADDGKPSAAGDRALRFAERQLGKPYAWGAQGPDSYDCSGLTAEAWATAGTPIPRTSQEQWAELPRVPLSDLRPGDLVLYFADATHVAIYAGKGMVIQAPRTGETIRRSPIASHPILGAVRPDADPAAARDAGRTAAPDPQPARLPDPGTEEPRARDLRSRGVGS
ncbi:C40 family peptidase [Streptomyces actuosus]|uniref:C40 family peptidase n=1 Tax=Streptomyces actuosus TaxID=1885 RepID=UPI0027DA2EB8|nr:NlpC/P60 family protein [Streptomyces actuosus]